ncbi:MULTISPECIES: ABC transporter permease [unclassified Nocardioides]|uniref:ABC transporter permease n=1 Tax=unclassified Nocardioides TaxID=2615069 RepID=UPI0009ECABC2|nr:MULTISPECIES: ABC transporter permease [unclassified Nocardioides]
MIDKLGPLGRELRAIWMLLFVAVLLFIATPDFLVTANLLNVLLAATVTALLGAGQTFVIIQGEIDLSVGAVLGLSGVTTALVLQDHSLVVGLGAGLLVGCVAGLVNGLLVTKTRMPSFIATLAMMSVVAGLTLRITEGNPVAVADEGFRAIGRAKPLGVPLPILIMLVVFVVFGLLLSRSRFGRYVYAVGDNPEAARLSGIPVDRVKISAFVISGLLAAIGGFILTARLSTAQPTAGSGLELAAIAAVIIGGTSLAGGRGALVGTAIGAVLLGTIDNGLNLLDVSPFLQDVVKGLVILFAVYLDRNGEVLRRLVRRATPTRRRDPAPTPVG